MEVDDIGGAGEDTVSEKVKRESLGEGESGA